MARIFTLQISFPLLVDVQQSGTLRRRVVQAPTDLAVHEVEFPTYTLNEQLMPVQSYPRHLLACIIGFLCIPDQDIPQDLPGLTYV